MTREEYIEQYPNPNQIGFEDAYEILKENAEKYINLLEQRIAELETPKTCEGCIYKDKIPLQRLYMQCGICARNSVIICDYYEPKDI